MPGIQGMGEDRIIPRYGLFQYGRKGVVDR